MAMLASTTRRRSAPWHRSHGASDTAVTEGRDTDGSSRGRAAVLRGCVMDGLFRETNRATVRAVRRAGFEVLDVPDQGCCGALHAHAGDLDGARELARVNVAAFARSGVSVIVSNAAGCGAMLESYGHLLADDPVWAERASRVAAAARDVSEVVAPFVGSATGSDHAAQVGAAPPVRVAYDPPCHLLHAQRVSAPPLAMLAAVPGIELVPLADADQ
jgi:glycolate oxidase iron-sulfur subunit